jgi:putative membrane protein
LACQPSGVLRRARWGTVNGVAQIAALVGALAYIGAAPLEMFFFSRPMARRFLHVEADNIADVRMWAFVVGFRNVLAGIATIVGLVILHTGDEAVGKAIVLTLCWYMLLASLAMGVADLLGYWRPRGGSVLGTIGSSLPPPVALIAAARLAPLSPIVENDSAGYLPHLSPTTWCQTPPEVLKRQVQRQLRDEVSARGVVGHSGHAGEDLSLAGPPRGATGETAAELTVAASTTSRRGHRAGCWCRNAPLLRRRGRCTSRRCIGGSGRPRGTPRRSPRGRCPSHR